MKKIIVFLLLLLFGVKESFADITAEEALNIAKKEVLCYGIDLDDKTTQIIRNETFEFFWYKKPFRRSDTKIQADSFRGGNFWAICFFPKDRSTYDGLLSVYIDASSGKIIGYEPMSPERIQEYKQEAKKEISIDEAISIVENFLAKEGIYTKEMIMTVIQNNFGLFEAFPKNNVFIRNNIANLDGYRDYWLFYYRPKGEFEKGDLGIVMDIHSGNILSFIK